MSAERYQSALVTWDDAADPQVALHDMRMPVGERFANMGEL